MKALKFFGITAAVLMGSCAFAQKSGCLIDADSVGPVHGGMTLAQARQALRGATFKKAEDAEQLPMYEVDRNGLHVMDLYVNVDEPLNDRNKIELIRVYDGSCATRDGIRPGMPLAGVAQRYGRIKRLVLTDVESREYAEFERQPSWMEIQVGNGQVGTFPPGKRCTTDYPADAHITSLWISHPMQNKLPDNASTCNAPPPRR